MFSHLFNTYDAVEPPANMKQESVIRDSYVEPDAPVITNFTGYDIEKPQINPYKRSYDDFYKIQEPILSYDNFVNQRINQSINEQNNIISDIIYTGRSLIGGLYTWGGNSPESGFDCSSFLQYIYKKNGVSIPRTTKDIFKTGKEVSFNDIKPGDIICTKGSGSTGRHVQMVTKVNGNQINVIEAKGRKYGIIEGVFNKKSSDIITIRRIINSPSIKSNGRFDNEEDFIKALNTGFQRALFLNGFNPKYSYVLTAQAALESGNGKHVSGTYNYGGIKSSEGTAAKTSDYVNGKLITHTQTFRNFDSVDDYCDYKVKLLAGSRYNAFKTAGPNNPYDFVLHVLSKGYGSDYGGPKSKEYATTVKQIYNKVLKTVEN